MSSKKLNYKAKTIAAKKIRSDKGLFRLVFILLAGMLINIPQAAYSATYADGPYDEAFELKLRSMEHGAEAFLKTINQLQREARKASHRVRFLKDRIQRLDQEIEFIKQNKRPRQHYDSDSDHPG